MSLLEAQGLILWVPGREAPLFEGVSLTLEQGEKIALTGSSGSGKTLFLRSLCHLENGVEGTILWKGNPVAPSEVPAFRSKVIYVGQRSSLGSGTVESSFSEAFSFRIHQEKRWDREGTLETLKSLGKSEDFLLRKVDVLSGGEKQLVNLLRAVALKPDVLCLDEPTSGLDHESCLRIESWLQKNYTGAWIWVTHQADQAQRVGGRQVRIGSLLSR